MSDASGTLVVTAFTPAVGSGQGLRTYGVVRALAGLGPVDLLYARFGADRPAAEFEAIEGLTMIPVQPSRGGRRALTYARALAEGIPRGFARGATRELASRAEELAAAAGRERVVADGPVAAASLRKLAARRPVTYNAHNLESSFRHLIGIGNRRERRRLERFEIRLLRSSDEVWMASPADVEAARELVPEARIRYVPNVIDTTEIRPASDPAGGVVLFVGDFTYPPNSQGLEYLESEVLPALWKLEPTARIEVVGRGLDREPTDPRISYLGFVPDLAAAYGRAACVVVPLLSGGGSPRSSSRPSPTGRRSWLPRWPLRGSRRRRAATTSRRRIPVTSRRRSQARCGANGPISATGPARSPSTGTRSNRCGSGCVPPDRGDATPCRRALPVSIPFR